MYPRIIKNALNNQRIRTQIDVPQFILHFDNIDYARSFVSKMV